MKNCPKCNAEVEDNFDVFWQCNYSFSENKIVEFEDTNLIRKKKINCLRCLDVPMIYSGEFKFHEGAKLGIFGSLFETFVNRECFDLYVCPKCGKVEFYEI